MRLADATDPEAAGAKAAALARAHQAGLPVLPGFVLTPDAADAVAAGARGRATPARAWAELTENGSQALVVRSSSTVEDGVDSSMAGRFESVLDVRGWDGFVDAVRAVVASGEAVHEGLPVAGRMAVLVQPFLVPDAGGVMFGADPVTGRTDRFVVAAVPGGPDQLVSGEVDGVTLTLTARGKVVESTGSIAAVDTNVRGLVALQKRAAERVRRPAGRRVGDRRRRRRHAPEPADHRHGHRHRSHRSDLRSRSGRRDVPERARAARARPLGRADGRRDPRGAEHHEHGVGEEARGVAGHRERARPRRRRPASCSASSSPPVRGRSSPASTRGRRCAASRSRGRSAGCAPRCPAWRATWSKRSTTCSPRSRTSPDLSDKQLIGLLDGTRQALRSVYGHEMLAGQLLDEESVPVTAAAAALRVLVGRAPPGRHRRGAGRAAPGAARARAAGDRRADRAAARAGDDAARARGRRGATAARGPAAARPLAPGARRLAPRWRSAVVCTRPGRLSEADAVRALSFAELRALVRRELAFAAPGSGRARRCTAPGEVPAHAGRRGGRGALEVEG